MTIITATDSNFNEILEASNAKPVLLKFSAQWCGPCKMLAPIVKQLAEEGIYAIQYADVDVDASPEVSARFQVRGIPFMLVLHNGQVVASKVGSISKTQLTAWIDLVLKDIEDRSHTTTV